MFYCGLESIDHTMIGKSRPFIHTRSITATAAMHEFIGADRLFDAELMKPPGVSGDILHHLEFCKVINLGRDVGPVVGHGKPVARRAHETIKRHAAASLPTIK